MVAAPPPPVAAPAAPVANAAAEEGAHHHHRDYCETHPGALNPRTGQLCPNVLGAQNLQH